MKIPFKTYVAKSGEYNSRTASTHDWSKVKEFENTCTMPMLGKAPVKTDYSDTAGFDVEIVNDDFSMPTLGSVFSTNG